MGKIGVIGGGIEGIETIQYLSAHGFPDITLFDQDSNLKVDLPPGVKKVFGPDYLKQAESCDTVFRSPGISLQKLANLRDKGVTITSATRYFFEHCPCKIIGVSGTKGKGTTSTLIYLMLKEAGKDVYLGGNIGEPPLVFLDKLKSDSYVVLELSSFQLQDLGQSPNVAVLLGVTSDHLDYHQDTDEYREAKASMVRYQKPEDLAVFNKDYEASEFYAGLTKARKIFVSAVQDLADGVHLSGPMIVNCAGSKCELISNVKKVALLGKHNLENVLPAVAVARHFGVKVQQIQNVISSFKGLPHRLEFAGEVNGVKFYDDSISTTPETSVAAVQAFEQPVILLAGGSDKGSDYTEWGLQLQQVNFLKAVVLVGHMATRMEQALVNGSKLLESRGVKRHYPLEILPCHTFEEAVYTAFKKANPGEVVVLSPAAASFDLFKNYKERGDTFSKIVSELL